MFTSICRSFAAEAGSNRGPDLRPTELRHTSLTSDGQLESSQKRTACPPLPHNSKQIPMQLPLPYSAEAQGHRKAHPDLSGLGGDLRKQEELLENPTSTGTIQGDG